jgi:hypothetical protein
MLTAADVGDCGNVVVSTSVLYQKDKRSSLVPGTCWSGIFGILFSLPRRTVSLSRSHSLQVSVQVIIDNSPLILRDVAYIVYKASLNNIVIQRPVALMCHCTHSPRL